MKGIASAAARTAKALLHLARAALTPAPRGVRVTRTRFEAAGERWPLTIPRGRVVTEGHAIYLRARGTTYALNGTARQHHQPIDPIWRHDEHLDHTMREAGATGTTPKIPLTPLLKIGRGHGRR